MSSRRERILFVCTANVDRSPTAEALYMGDPRYEVVSAGTAPFARVALTEQMLLWADRVFVMCERLDGHASRIRKAFPDVERPIVDLDVEDRFFRDDPRLVALLLRRLEPHLGVPKK
jgi:predicted protein tyrosine phosphatase